MSDIMSPEPMTVKQLREYLNSVSDRYDDCHVVMNIDDYEVPNHAMTMGSAEFSEWNEDGVDYAELHLWPCRGD